MTTRSKKRLPSFSEENNQLFVYPAKLYSEFLA